jgi:hypothetical protein
MIHGQVLPSILVYLLAAVLMTAAGLALLHAWPGLPTRQRILVAPQAGLASWSLVLGITGALSVRVRLVAWPLWIATILLAVIGGILLRRHWDATARRATVGVVACLLVPAVTLLSYFAFGLQDYAGTRFPDAWSYAAYGQYLWTFPRGVSGDLGPLYEFAAHLAGTRHVSSSLLGLLSCLIAPGDTQAAAGLLMPLVIFALATSCLAVAAARQLSARQTLLFVLCTAGSGWILNAVGVSNYDNLVALGTWPALAALCWSAPLDRTATWVGFGIGLAALIYAYPEFGTVMAAGWGALCAWQLWKAPVASWWRHAAVMAIAVLLLLAPYVREVLLFILSQARFGLSGGVRPGSGNFEGLVMPKYILSAIWALGGEHQYVRLIRPRSLVGALLLVVLAVGVLRWLRRRELGLLAALVIPIGGTTLLLLQHGYAYGAYKMLLAGWWLLMLAMVEVDGGSKRQRWVPFVVTCLLLSMPLVAAARALRPILLERPSSTLAEFRTVQEVATLVGSAPVGVFVEDGEAEQWATYFLRGTRMRLGTTRGYFAMGHVRHAAETDVLPWSAVRFLLTDATDPGPVIEQQDWIPVWQSRRYKLWDTRGHWAVVAAAATPNGFEQVDGRPFFWLGGGPSTFTVIASQQGCLVLDGDAAPGLSVRRATRAMRIGAGADKSRLFTAGQDIRIRVPIDGGRTDLAIESLDTADVSPSGGDPRQLLLGVRALRLGLIAAPHAEVTVSAPHGNEQWEGPFFWVGRAPARIVVTAAEDGDAVLVGGAVPGPSLTGTSTRRLRVTFGGRAQEVIVSGGRLTLPLHLAAGANEIQVAALDQPNVRSHGDGDTRDLLMGLRNVTVAAAPSAECRW